MRYQIEKEESNESGERESRTVEPKRELLMFTLFKKHSELIRLLSKLVTFNCYEEIGCCSNRIEIEGSESRKVLRKIEIEKSSEQKGVFVMILVFCVN